MSFISQYQGSYIRRRLKKTHPEFFCECEPPRPLKPHPDELLQTLLGIRSPQRPRLKLGRNQCENFLECRIPVWHINNFTIIFY
jgi:hypothetical protein